MPTQQLKRTFSQRLKQANQILDGSDPDGAEQAYQYLMDPPINVAAHSAHSQIHYILLMSAIQLDRREWADCVRLATFGIAATQKHLPRKPIVCALCDNSLDNEEARIRLLNHRGIAYLAQSLYAEAYADHTMCKRYLDTLAKRGQKLDWNLAYQIYRHLIIACTELGHFAAIIESREAAVQAAESIAEPRRAGWLYWSLNWAYTRMKEPAMAARFGIRGMLLLQHVNEIGSAVELRAQVSLNLIAGGDLDKAETMLTDGINLAQSVNDANALSLCYQNLAELRQRQGRYAEMLTLLEQAQAVIPDDALPLKVGQLWRDRGDAHRLLNQLGDAVASYDKALAIFVKSSAQKEIDETHYAQSLLIAARGDYETAWNMLHAVLRPQNRRMLP